LWQISNQEKREIIPDAPLRILKKFKPSEEWLLEPGDMLYLPPNYAHHGIAKGECMTYSIGFRAPGYQELASEFLHYLQDKITLDGLYSDRDLVLSKHPALLPKHMVNKIFKKLQKIQFNKHIVRDFLGEYLSVPKPNLFFNAPDAPLTFAKFIYHAKKTGIVLDLKTQMLYTSNVIYVNGETYKLTSMPNYFKLLADQRQLVLPVSLGKNEKNILYDWYIDGYLHLL
jgi:50S ribosomal protein L16 3-hydroxylase